MKKLIQWLFKSRVKKIDIIFNKYEELLKEYQLIENKQSKLSRVKREEVCAQVFFLISKGHLKININK